MCYKKQYANGLTKSGISPQIFIEVTNIKFQGNPSNGSSADTCEETDGRTDMTKATGAFRDYGNAPKNKNGKDASAHVIKDIQGI